jgi:hypothetical protein
MKISVITIVSAALCLGFASSLRAEDRATKPIYELQFEDGSLANLGSISGEAEEKSPPGGKPTFEITQDTDFGNWVLRQLADENLQQGPYLILPESQDRVRLSDPAQTASVAFWINWAGPINHQDSRQMLINCLAKGYKSGWALSITKQGAIRFDWTGEGDASGNRITSNTISPGEWHHVALVWENRPTVYIDGMPAAFTMPFVDIQSMAASDSPLVVGADVLHYLPFRGSLAGIRIYETPLSADDVFDLSQKKP